MPRSRQSRMGPRPVDFDEDLVRQSPTFIRWTTLQVGHKLRYACRDFIKGNGDDEERLMRRIMIARRNNVKDNETLKCARQTLAVTPLPDDVKETKRRRFVTLDLSDSHVADEMDVPAVEGTRSYRSWMALEDGTEFIYNQKYIKGKEGQDWLLRKNIWRRMRYRRQSRSMVEKLKGSKEHHEHLQQQRQRQNLSAVTGIVKKHALNKAVVAESFANEPRVAANDDLRVHNPLDEAASNEALDAAAKLAAASAALEHEYEDDEELEEGEVEDHEEDEEEANDISNVHCIKEEDVIEEDHVIQEESAIKEEYIIKEEHDMKVKHAKKEEPESVAMMV